MNCGVCALLFPACTLVSDAELDAKLRRTETGIPVDTSADSSAGVGDAPTIDSISPTWGTTLGGTEITLSGSFAADAAVRVGGIEATVIDLDPETRTLIFSAPATAAEGVAEVVLLSNGQTATLDGGYTYYADGTGKVGLIGTITWFDQVGTYWSGEPVDVGYAYLFPVEPTSYEWGLSFSGAQDTCESDQGGYVYAPTAYVYDVGEGSTATLDSTAAPFTLAWDAASLSLAAVGLTAAEIAPGADYDLVDLQLAEAVFPPYTLAAVASMPTAFYVSMPNLSGSSPPRVGRAFDLYWTGDNEWSDHASITLNLWNSAGTGYQEVVRCDVHDDGSFTIPDSVWQTTWPTSRQLDILVARYAVADGLIPYNNASPAVMAEYVIYGAAFTE